MQAHPGGGERRAQLPQRRSGKQRDSRACLCWPSFGSDSPKCHHIVEMFICEERIVLLINYACSFEILLNLGVKQVSSKQASNRNHLNVYKKNKKTERQEKGKAKKRK